MESSRVDQKRLKIAYHETGHAVMALLCKHPIQKVSLKEMDSPGGTDKYLAFMKLESVDSTSKYTGKKAIQKIMISLGGFASEILFYDGVTGIGGDDLTVAIKVTEDMLQIGEFKDWVNRLPTPVPSTLDNMVKNPSIRAYIDLKIGDTVRALELHKPAIQIIAEELFKKEELTGEKVSSLFNSFV